MTGPGGLREQVERFFGSRGAQAARAAESLDELSSADLSSVLTLVSEHRARLRSVADATRQSRFHQPSPVSPRIMHAVESLVFDIDRDTEYVDLSPLQPFGVNRALTGINQKNVVSALRQSEVNADITTALFTECLAREVETIRLAAHCRSVRAQKFPEGSPLLPHFKMWASVSLGRHGTTDGHDNELATLADHLAREVEVVDRVVDQMGVPGVSVKVSISNVLLSRQLAEAGVIEIPHVKVIHPGSVADVPADSDFATSADAEHLVGLGLTKGAHVTGLFRSVLAERHPQLLGRLVLDLHRKYGVGYYQHVCYKIGAGLPDGNRVPIADGGTTDWARVATRNRHRFLVTSGIGTELLSRYLVAAERIGLADGNRSEHS